MNENDYRMLREIADLASGSNPKPSKQQPTKYKKSKKKQKKVVLTSVNGKKPVKYDPHFYRKLEEAASKKNKPIKLSPAPKVRRYEKVVYEDGTQEWFAVKE